MKYPRFLPVLHIDQRVGWNKACDLAQRNLDIMAEAGADGVFFINQHIETDTLLRMMVALDTHGLEVGLNLLGYEPGGVMGIAAPAATHGPISMVWSDDAAPEALATCGLDRDGFTGSYFGGVGFKYQRPLPDADIASACQKCGTHVDFITTSGPATGHPPRRERLIRFADALCERQKLAIASGVTVENLESLVLDDTRPDGRLVHAVLVASGIETSFGVLNEHKTKAMGRLFEKIRG